MSGPPGGWGAPPPPSHWGPPPPARTAAPSVGAAVVIGRVMSLLLVGAVLVWAFALLFVSLASVMTLGGCTGDGSGGGACGARGWMGLAAPWVGWILGLVVGIAGIAVHWRRLLVWVWGPAAVLLTAAGMWAALTLLFGWTWWVDLS